jgi:serine/threonine protein kinase
VSPPPTSGYSRLNNRYQINALIGNGGMAAVYEAHDEFLGRDVAVKLFEATATRVDDVADPEQELQILARLNHHSLVTLMDAGVVAGQDPDQSRRYLVMELVRGSTLKQLIARKSLAGRDIGHIGADIAEGLKYIHHNGVIHRDVKPANVLMVDYLDDGSERPRAKLGDFGIAQLAGCDEGRHRTSTTGTAAYLSPEQAMGEAVGPASDIYSLGLVLLECFTRTTAFGGSSVVESAVARLEHGPAIPGTLPVGWSELLAAMTAREADDRPEIDEVIKALQELAQQGKARHSAVDTAPLSTDETARMLAVERYDILDTPPDGAFDRITAMAARLFDAPIAIVSIVDHDRIWFKSKRGVDIEEVSRDGSLSTSAILHDEPWVVTDTRTDPLTMTSAVVAGAMGIQFYVAVPLQTSDGHNLGTLCVLDYEARPAVAEEDMRNLEDLAAMVMSELELRLATRRTLGATD